ncbi:fungal-specific transcription factor domain-containing protein [Mycena maculata]|uniref:Fungal-specific transcription factor domain-containing protein n=1 Tax=Mycena maculata TaxID=230809 RepID=A0AAD7IEC8_9AGAR|nr:fungal-specific transcription factor domain-containing protein [Mycena maculata]
MADPQEDNTAPGTKRRRLRGSCDKCKQRKIRCDSSEMPGNRCSNCIAFSSECTHSLKSVAKIIPTPPGQDVSEAHKSAQAHVAAIVVRATGYIPAADLRQVLTDVARYARDLENQLATRPSPPSGSATSSPSSLHRTIEEKEETGILSERFDRFRMDSDADRYFGKSSNFELINTAMELKDGFVQAYDLPILPPVRRPEFWMSPWEHMHLASEPVFPPLVFPEPDLLETLVSLFFTKVNIVLCLLHRPTFEQSLASGRHLTNHQFGFSVLALCAVAAKYSDDPRVVLEGTNSQLSSGWKYFRQLLPLQKPLMRPCTLYEAQTLCLCVFYLQGSSAPDACWTIGGASVRFAQEVGVHRKNRFDNKIEAEQWKRVFWILVCIDTLASSFCGRPRATSSSDYDLDYPIECDDEYWETDDPAMAFKQPPGKPSVVSYTIAYLKLIEILGMAQQTIYLVNRKDKSEEWTRDVVAELDSALNAWIDVVPPHLRWDPHIENPLFATQSAVLYACYYHVQIQVHRIFIAPPPAIARARGTSCLSLNYPSLAICANSARVCSHVMGIASRRGFLCNPHILNAIFDACIILLLNVWGGRNVGLAVDPQKCLEGVETCRTIFRAYESRWQIAGRYHDIIAELMSATNMDSHMSATDTYTPNPLKRGLDSTESPSSGENSDSRVHGDEGASTQAPFHSDASLDPLFALPMYTEDLGRLPIYEPLNWTESWSANANPQDGILLPDDIRQIVAPSGLLPDSAALLPDSLSAIGETPAGYDWGDWGKYITDVEELMNSLGNESHTTS